MRVLVVGGSGLIGYQLLPRLVRAGHTVTVLSRGHRAVGVAGVIHVIGDRHEVFRGRLPLGPFDSVIDNVAYTAEDVQQVLESFGGRLPHYVVASTAFVYPDIDTAGARPWRPYTEDDFDVVPASGTEEASTAHGRYVHDKRRMESWLKTVGQVQYETAITVIRPLLQIVGPNTIDGRFAWFWLRVRDGGPVWLPNEARAKAGPCQLAFSGDVAEVEAAAIARLPGRWAVYNAGQPEVWTYEEYIRMMGNVAGTNPEIRYAPREVLNQWANGVYRIPLPYPVTFDVTRQVRDLGVRPTPMQRWIQDTGQWATAFYGDRQPESWFAQRAEELQWPPA